MVLLKCVPGQSGYNIGPGGGRVLSVGFTKGQSVLAECLRHSWAEEHHYPAETDATSFSITVDFLRCPEEANTNVFLENVTSGQASGNSHRKHNIFGLIIIKNKSRNILENKIPWVRDNRNSKWYKQPHKDFRYSNHWVKCLICWQKKRERDSKGTRSYKNDQAVLKKNQMEFLRLKIIKTEIKKKVVALFGSETKTSQMKTGHFFRVCW